MLRHRLRQESDGFSLVELLVVLVLLGIVGTAVTSVVVSTLRTQTYQQELREAAGESRVVFERIRKEIRSARRVLDSSTDGRLDFWVDSNVDGLQQLDELVTYEVCVIAGSPGRYRVQRYTQADGTPPSCADGRIFAETLRNNDPFTYVKTNVALPNSAANAVQFNFTYDVNTVSGPEAFDTSSTVRLRNVA